MALNTYGELWKYVLLRCPIAGPFLPQEWITFAFREIAENRRWSWLVKQNQLLVPNVVSDGLVNVTFNDPVVVGIGTTWTGALVGRQFRIGLSTPIYTIASVDDVAQTLTLTEVWGAATTLSVNYLAYQAYFTMPDDFLSFISCWDPSYNWQLWTRVLQTELNLCDAQRSNSGTAYALSFRDYNPLVAVGTPSTPRYELWPHQFGIKPFPYLYWSRPVDINDPNAAIPRYVRGDIILEGALWKCAEWPGPSKDQPNPYFNLALADRHKSTFFRYIMDIERNDDEIDPDSVQYASSGLGMQFAPFPMLDARFLQSHAF
jgi:hypothetical protein